MPPIGVGAGLRATLKMLRVAELTVYMSTYAMAKCPQVRIGRVLAEKGVYVGVYEKMDRVTVVEAAARLGVKEQAIRKRIQRGTLAHDKDEDGRVHVYLDPEYVATGAGNGIDTGMDTLVQSLQEQIVYLRQESEDWKEEARCKDTIIMSLTQRIPELEAATEPREVFE